jgi:hypothetical protein
MERPAIPRGFTMIVLGINPAIREQMRRYKDQACDCYDRMLTIVSKDDFREAVAMAMKLEALREAMIEASFISGQARGGPECSIVKEQPVASPAPPVFYSGVARHGPRSVAFVTIAETRDGGYQYGFNLASRWGLIAAGIRPTVYPTYARARQAVIRAFLKEFPTSRPTLRAEVREELDDMRAQIEAKLTAV